MIFQILGIVLTANGSNKSVRMGGDEVKVSNLWLVLFAGIDLCAMFAYWGILSNPTLGRIIIAAIPTVSILVFAHLFAGRND